MKLFTEFLKNGKSFCPGVPCHSATAAQNVHHSVVGAVFNYLFYFYSFHSNEKNQREKVPGGGMLHFERLAEPQL